MMSLTFGLFTQVSGLGPLGPLVLFFLFVLLTLFSGSHSIINTDSSKNSCITYTYTVTLKEKVIHNFTTYQLDIKSYFL